MFVRSRYFENKENKDTSNFSEEWGDGEIENDEGGMRTIREFPLGMGQQDKSKAGRSLVEKN
jgi:hypothetical protein